MLNEKLDLLVEGFKAARQKESDGGASLTLFEVNVIVHDLTTIIKEVHPAATEEEYKVLLEEAFQYVDEKVDLGTLIENAIDLEAWAKAAPIWLRLPLIGLAKIGEAKDVELAYSLIHTQLIPGAAKWLAKNVG